MQGRTEILRLLLFSSNPLFCAPWPRAEFCAASLWPVLICTEANEGNEEFCHTPSSQFLPELCCVCPLKSANNSSATMTYDPKSTAAMLKKETPLRPSLAMVLGSGF